MLFPRATRLALYTALIVTGPSALAAENEPTLSTALQQSIRLQEEIDRYNEQIADLESEFGPYDRNLLESLQGLTGILIEAQDYEEVDSILNRRLQLIRTNEGPDSLLQLPILEEAIANDIRRADWSSVTDRYDFRYWLHMQDEALEPEVLLRVRDEIARWHLAALYIDDPRSRVTHFMAARELQRENLRSAEELYGEDSAEVAPWLYESIVQSHRLHGFLNSNDEAGFDLRREILGASYMEQQKRDLEEWMRLANQGFPGRPPPDPLERELDSVRNSGFNAIKRLREIQEATGDLEAQAMALVYLADFELVADRGSATSSYREAREKMVEAGLDEALIDDFFSRPMVVPAPRFHTTVADAIAAQDARGYRPADQNDGVTHLGSFEAWHESLPDLQRPGIPELASSAVDLVENDEIVFEFRLNSRGRTSNPKVVTSTVESARTRSDSREALREMQFRPRFEGSRLRPMDDLQITYTVPKER